MSLDERIVAVRQHAGLTQEAFAEKIGTARSTIAKYEKGINVPAEITLRSIARVYGISYDWLKTGEGEMLVETDDLAELLAKCLINENETAQAVFKAFAQLDESDWQTIAKLIEGLKK